MATWVLWWCRSWVAGSGRAKARGERGVAFLVNHPRLQQHLRVKIACREAGRLWGSARDSPVKLVLEKHSRLEQYPRVDIFCREVVELRGSARNLTLEVVQLGRWVFVLLVVVLVLMVALVVVLVVLVRVVLFV